MDEVEELRLENNHEATAKLAYDLWERRGCPLGSPEVEWTLAERILASFQESSGKKSPRVELPRESTLMSGAKEIAASRAKEYRTKTVSLR